VDAGVVCKSNTGAQWELTVLYQIKNPVFLSLTSLLRTNGEGMWWTLGKTPYNYYTDFPDQKSKKKLSPKDFENSISINMDITRKIQITINAPFPSLKGQLLERRENTLPA
jgi:hypothetical protein